MCKDDIQSWVRQLTFEREKENSFLSVHSCGRARQCSGATEPGGQGRAEWCPVSTEQSSRPGPCLALPGPCELVTGGGLGLVLSWSHLTHSQESSDCGEKWSEGTFCSLQLSLCAERMCFVQCSVSCSFLMSTFRKWLDLALLFATQCMLLYCTLQWILSIWVIMCSRMLYVSSS